MTIETDIKTDTSTVAVEEGQSVTSTVVNTQKDGEKVTQPKKEENQQPFRVFTSQTDFDNEAAKIKYAGAKDVLKKFGIKSEDDIPKMLEAYNSSLTEAEKTTQKLAELEAIKQQAKRKDYVINALVKKSNEPIEDVEKQVTMAEALVSTGHYSTFDEAFEFVWGNNKTQVEKQELPPQGKQILQPDTSTQTEKNPFKDGTLQEQTELFKKDPDKARRFAKEAGKLI